MDREQGAVAVMVAIFVAFVALGAAAISLDLGSLFQTQRGLVTDTDAMALAGARTLAAQSQCTSSGARSAVEAEVEAVRQLNDNDEVLDVQIDCQPGNRAGTVRVFARQGSDSYFSGEPDLGVAGWTEAEWEREIGLLSPLAFCANQLPSDSVTLDASEGAEIYYSSPNNNPVPSDVLCPTDWSGGGSPTLPGGWGWLMTESDGSLSLLCGETLEENWCQGDPGNNLMQSWIVDNGDEFSFPIFDRAEGQGANGEWRIVGIGRAELIGCSGSGNTSIESGPFTGNCGGNPRFISLDVSDITMFGDIEELEEFVTRVELSISDVGSRDG